MIKAEFFRTAQGKSKGFAVSGHAGTAPFGRDLVCAAVSATTLTAAMGITEVLSIDVRASQEDGFLSCFLPEGLTDGQYRDVSIILDTLLAGLRAIEADNPKALKVIINEDQ